MVKHKTAVFIEKLWLYLLKPSGRERANKRSNKSYQTANSSNMKLWSHNITSNKSILLESGWIFHPVLGVSDCVLYCAELSSEWYHILTSIFSSLPVPCFSRPLVVKNQDITSGPSLHANKQTLHRMGYIRKCYLSDLISSKWTFEFEIRFKEFLYCIPSRTKSSRILKCRGLLVIFKSFLQCLVASGSIYMILQNV